MKPRQIATIAFVMLLGGTQPQGHAQAQVSPKTGAFTNFTCVRRAFALGLCGKWLWIGTDGGLFQLEPDTGKVHRLLTTADGIAGNCIADLLVDGMRLWVASDGGVTVLDTGTGSVRSQSGRGSACRFLRTNTTGHFIAWGGNQVWRLRGHAGEWQSYDLAAEPLERCLSLVVDGQTAWALVERQVTQNGAPRAEYGVLRVDLARGHTQPTALTHLGDILGYERHQSIQVTEGRVWVLLRGRLYCLNQTTLKWEDLSQQGFPAGAVSSIVPHHGDLWAIAGVDYDAQACMALTARLCRFDSNAGQWKRYPKIGRCRFDQPTCLAVLDGELWVATKSYDEMKRTLVARAMADIERQVPKTIELTLARYQPGTEGWSCFHVPIESSLEQFHGLAKTEDAVWAALVWRDPRPGQVNRWPSSRRTCRVDTAAGKQAVHWYPFPEPRTYGLAISETPPIQVARAGDRSWLLGVTTGSCTVGTTPSLYHISGQKWDQIRLPSALVSEDMTALTCADGDIYLGTGLGGVFRWAEGKACFELVDDKPLAQVHSLAPHPEGGLLIGRLCRGDLRPSFGQSGPVQASPLLLGGLFWWRPEGLKAPVARPPTQEAHGYFQWAAWPERRSESASKSSSRGSGERDVRAQEAVSDIAVKGSEIFVGTWTDGVFWLKDGQWRQLRPHAPSEDPATERVPRQRHTMVSSLDSHGDSLWVTTPAGLFHCQLPTGLWTLVPNEQVTSPAERSESPAVSGTWWSYRGTDMVRVCADRVWLVHKRDRYGRGGAIYYRSMDKPDWQRIPEPTEARSFAAQSRYVWFGGVDGLLRLDPGSQATHLIRYQDGLAGRWVQALAVQGDYLWVGTSNGLTRIDTRQLENGKKPPR